MFVCLFLNYADYVLTLDKDTEYFQCIFIFPGYHSTGRTIIGISTRCIIGRMAIIWWLAINILIITDTTQIHTHTYQTEGKKKEKYSIDKSVTNEKENKFK